jgi:16S rRNA (adenine(1408)-N(1))-methyltransferase
MLRVLSGKNIGILDSLEKYTENFQRIEADIGTGDGRFVYFQAKKNRDVFYIGIDPVAENMFEYSSKSVQKPSKGGVSNVLYIVAAAEDMPRELSNIADKIYITLPWGSLLEGIIKGDPLILVNISSIAKKQAAFEFLFTYDVFHEANEIVKRGLPILTIDYIKIDLIERYAVSGFLVEEVNMLTEKELRAYQTTWAKRLGFGRMREVFIIKGTIDSKRG